MIVAAVSLPNPPLLLPGITGGRVAEVEQLRTACLAAIQSVLETGPELMVLVGAVGAGEQNRPLTMAVGRSLLEQANCALVIEEIGVASDAPAKHCLQLGSEIAHRPERVCLFVLADGSARRSLKAPGYFDERAADFDAMVINALESNDWRTLAALDPARSVELMAAGRAVWQVLAGGLAVSEDAGAAFKRTTHYIGDPFGVYYPVVSYVSDQSRR